MHIKYNIRTVTQSKCQHSGVWIGGGISLFISSYVSLFVGGIPDRWIAWVAEIL